MLSVGLSGRLSMGEVSPLRAHAKTRRISIIWAPFSDPIGQHSGGLVIVPVQRCCNTLMQQGASSASIFSSIYRPGRTIFGTGRATGA
jgi:hypothetical protein